MKLKTCFTAFFAFTLSCLAATPPPDKLLPADTLAVFTVPEYAKTRATTRQWPGRQLWVDAAMKPFVDKFVGKLQSDLITPLEREFGLRFSDFADLAQGQFTLAVTQGSAEDKASQTPGFLLLLDARDKSESLRTNLTGLKKKWIDSGKQIKSDKVRDVEFTTYLFSSDDFSKTLDKAFPDPNAGNETLDAPKPKKTAKKTELLVGQSGSLLVVGNSSRDIEKILACQSGSGVPSLSEQSSFSSLYASHFRDALGYGWINLKSIMDLVIKQAGGGGDNAGRNPMMPKPDKILGAVGLSGVRSLSFDLKEAPEGWLMSFLLSVPEGDRKGLIKILSAEAKESGPPPFVPATAVKFTRWRIDLQKAFATLENMITEITPQGAAGIKAMIDMAGKDKDPDFDLRKNLIANLGDDFIAYSKTPRQQTFADLSSPPTLYLLSSPKAEQLAGAIKALGSLMPQQAKLKEREFLGRKVYTMGLPTPPGPRGGKTGGPNSLSYAASGGYVAFSSDMATLEEFLRGNTEKPLRQTPGMAEAAEKIGGLGTGLFTFQNDNEIMRSMLETLKKESGTIANFFNALPLAGRLGMDEDAKKFKDWVDFSLLPNFDSISKYFYYTVWTGNANSQGLEFKGFGPTSPQLRK